MSDPVSDELFDAQLKTLRSSISDLGHQVDSEKTATAGALGGGVFLLLLGVGAAYDLFTNKGAAWLTLGVTRETLNWIAGAFGSGGIGLMVFALIRIRMRDTGVDVRLEQMEQEYAELLRLREAAAQRRP